MFHISLLRQFCPDEAQDLSPELFQPDLIIEEDKYEVEVILDKRWVKCQVQYLIKWKGFPTYEASWEPITNLSGCKDLLE